MSYVDQVLAPGETVVYRSRLSGWIAFWPITIGALLSIITAGIGLVLALPWWFAVWLRWRAAEFAVTSERVVLKDGILRRRSAELLVNRVESANVEQGILGRLFGYGTVLVVGTGGTRERFSGIDNPMRFAEQVRQAIITHQRPAPLNPPTP